MPRSVTISPEVGIGAERSGVTADVEFDSGCDISGESAVDTSERSPHPIHVTTSTIAKVVFPGNIQAVFIGEVSAE